MVGLSGLSALAFSSTLPCDLLPSPLPFPVQGTGGAVEEIRWKVVPLSQSHRQAGPDEQAQKVYKRVEEGQTFSPLHSNLCTENKPSKKLRQYTNIVTVNLAIRFEPCKTAHTKPA